MTDIRFGDRVRLTREAVVAGYAGGVVTTADGFAYSPNTYHIEVLGRAKPQVGDTVEGFLAYGKLPVGTVVQNTDGALYQFEPGHWRDVVTGGECTDLFDKRTILFLPDGAAQ